MIHDSQILYEDNHLLVVNKAAELPTMGVSDGRPTLLDAAKRHIKEKYHKPGNVYLGIVSRLDAPVTGAIVMARTSKAASRLTAAYRDGKVEKRYWALVDPQPDSKRFECVDWVRKDERHRKMHVCRSTVDGAREARLRFHVIRRLSNAALLDVCLETGRKHQIRLQLGSRGWPVLGDRKYGSQRSFPQGIALHSRYVRLEHPVRREPLEIVAPLPPYWPKASSGDRKGAEAPRE